MVKVTNHQARLLIIGAIPGTNDELRLIPGVNVISVETAKALEDESTSAGRAWAQWQALSWITLMLPKAKEKIVLGPEAPKSLVNYSDAQAMALVEIETDLAILADWLTTESRVDVRAAIQMRFVALSPSEE